MKLYVRGRSSLILGHVSGSPGLLENANFSYGWLLMIGAGQLIDLLKEICRTQSSVLFAIRRKKQSTTCCPVYLLGSSGSSYYHEWGWATLFLRRKSPFFRNGGGGSYPWPTTLIKRASAPSSSLGYGLWRLRNDCVFNGSAPRSNTALVMAGEQIIAWNMAGAKGLAMISNLGEELEG
jgi:hypothetical protein